MEKDIAIKILIANAVCTDLLLNCKEHCPCYVKGENDENGFATKCNAPTIDEIKEAVLALMN